MQHSAGTLANRLCVCVCACTCVVRNPPLIYMALPLLVTNCWCSNRHLFTLGLQKTKAHEISHSCIHHVQVFDSPTNVLFFPVNDPRIISASNHFCRSAPKCKSLGN